MSTRYRNVEDGLLVHVGTLGDWRFASMIVLRLVFAYWSFEFGSPRHFHNSK